MFLKISMLQAKNTTRYHGTTKHAASKTPPLSRHNKACCRQKTPTVVTEQHRLLQATHPLSRNNTTRCHGTTLIKLQFYPYQAVV
jgi:hypothetical protein